MVGDGGSTSEISVPLVFLFSKEGQVLLDALEEHSSVEVLLLPRNKQLGQGSRLQESVQPVHGQIQECLN